MIEDYEGEDYPSLDMAREDAVVSARQMMADKIRQGEVVDGQIIEIWDETGVCLAEVVFAEQLAVCKPVP